jgi:hypothetical protein
MATMNTGRDIRSGMPIERRRRWQDGATLVLGLWIFVTAWLFTNFRAESTINAWATGAVLFAVSLWALFSRRALVLETVAGLAGLWLIASPWAIHVPGADAINNWVCGALIAIFAFSAVSRPSQP